MRDERRIADLKRMLQAIIYVCLASAGITLAIGFWIPAKAEFAQVLLERAWIEERAGNGDTKPWPWADTTPIARLSIPALDTSWIVLTGASGRNLAFAPAHMDGSAAPGAAGVTVIAGHRDTHFRALQSVEVGMAIVVQDTEGRTQRYSVTGIEVVDSTETRIRLDGTVPALVLTTCYPFDALTAGGPLRFLVSAEAAL
jgi:sortase A